MIATPDTIMIEGILHIDTARAATLMGKTRRQVQAWIRQGKLSALRINHNCYLLPLENLKAFTPPRRGRPNK